MTPLKADKTIEELAVVSSTQHEARECAKDCLRDLACDLQDASHEHAGNVFAMRMCLTEEYQIRNAMMGLELFTGARARNAHRAVVNLLAVMVREENDQIYEEEPTLDEGIDR